MSSGMGDLLDSARAHDLQQGAGHARPLAVGWPLSASLLAACAGGSTATPPISPGTSASPREVNIITKDYSYLPPEVDLVPGETVLLHVINGGLEVHEVVIGDTVPVQDAWEAAEAAAANPPPGPTPLVSVPAACRNPDRGPVGRAGRPALDGPAE